MPREKKVVVFASGRGTLFKHMVDLKEKYPYQIRLLVCSNAKADALEVAVKHNIKQLVVKKNEENDIIDQLNKIKPDLIILAGYLKKVPTEIVDEYSGKIFNTHPSLLPKYGGQGMYGLNVHRAVLAAGDSVTGCTIHKVSNEYDEGEVVSQISVDVELDETPESLQQKVKKVEKVNLENFLNKFFKTVEN